MNAAYIPSPREFLRGRRAEYGQSLALLAGGLAVFLGLVGLSVDVGQLVHLRTDLQKTADAAAFAGAQDLPSADDAKAAANAYVTSNRSRGTVRDVQVGTTNETNDPTSVTAADETRFIFLGMLGMHSRTVNATAVVRIDVVTGYSFDDYGVFPYALWGGARVPQKNGAGNTVVSPVNPNCTYGICPGSKQLFRGND